MRERIRDFYGAFSGVFSRGIFVTCGTFSLNTTSWARQRKDLELVDGEQLTELFVKHKPEINRHFGQWDREGYVPKALADFFGQQY